MYIYIYIYVYVYIYIYIYIYIYNKYSCKHGSDSNTRRLHLSVLQPPILRRLHEYATHISVTVNAY